MVLRPDQIVDHLTVIKKLNKPFLKFDLDFTVAPPPPLSFEYQCASGDSDKGDPPNGIRSASTGRKSRRRHHCPSLQDGLA